MALFNLAVWSLTCLFAVFQPSFANEGEATHYAPAMGACGKVHGPNDMVAALSHEDYGTWPNPNNAPVCGKCINVKATQSGKQVKVKIVDECPGCPSGSLDLSTAAFKKLAPLEEGRIPITWSTVKC